MIIDVMGTKITEIDLFPETIVDEIMQNIKVILTTIAGTVPLDRSFGISSNVIDQPTQRAIMGLTVEIIESIRLHEPRVEVTNVEFNNTEEVIDGKLIPKVRVRILDEYI